MQAPATSTLIRAAQDLPSPDSDQEFGTPADDSTTTTATIPTSKLTLKPTNTADMVTLPSSPSSLFTGSPSSNNNNANAIPCCSAIVMQAPTPVTPSKEDDDDNEPTRHLSEQDKYQHQLTPMVVPAKRGYKSHVPSACVNCKKAHLACDVSRPCKRCVSAGKGDTCQDVKHKKRGRPRLHETKRLGNVYGGSMILDNSNNTNSHRSDMMYGMIQTPTFTVATSVVHRDHPKPQTTSISFVHEPIEAFREQDEQRHRKKDVNHTTGTRSQQTLRDPEPPPTTSVIHHQSSPTLISKDNDNNKNPKSPPFQRAVVPTTRPSHQAQIRLSCELPCPTSTTKTTKTTTRTTNPRNTPAATTVAQQPQPRECVTITLFLSMEMCCARASDEVTDLWGFHPQDLVHRSLYEMISTHDADRLGRLHRLLLDNIMEVARQHDRSIGPDVRPPPAERTSSSLFYDTDPEKLVRRANGSNTFSDTLHFKKQSNEHELYEMLVYLGGGLGADLTMPPSLEKLYIVAELRKHEYKVQTANTSTTAATAGLPASLSFDRSRLFSPFVHSSPTSSSSSTTATKTTAASSSLSSLSFPSQSTAVARSRTSSSNGPSSTTTATTTKPREYSFGRLGSGGLLQARQGSLPNHFAANSQLNTVSLPSRKLDIPKINIAPMTGKKRSNTSVTGVPYFRPIAAAIPTATTTTTTATPTTMGSYGKSHSRNSNNITPTTASSARNSSPLPPVARESTNPYSTLAYKFAPITSSGIPDKARSGSGSGSVHGSLRGGPPSYTHPTTQYFLQTSSSTLNAAASAAQSSSRPIAHHNIAIDTMANNDKAVGKTDSKRKAEMSIRSLLC
ncbi:hypothetical protein BDB00DRAFT_495614 [Zychaea mexicana]|uniref:uncharacterized protein n=1 Tax=Zychaea mexicana TaxID=64656 RepID=UPI0022FE70FF|nr:uncharacterized protein BDB00DRAFT_495614 [Zychaea mexicana]KAI9498033.1 hypothetical protein BDB00DRAFT_495614 [Zychaea mexicana]